MSRDSPLATVIVVCWNSAEVLGRCLEQLLCQDYQNYEIVVVDDGSQDDTVEVAERALGSGRLTIVQSTLNRGCPHARNLGLLHARGEFIAFIDADGFAATGWLTHVVAAFQADPSVGGVASTVFMASNPLVLNGAGGIVNQQGWAADLCMNVPYDRAEIASEVLYPMGCGMALRRSALDRIGHFDDCMLNYYDDVDYGIRVWRAGYRVVVAPDAWIDHGFGHSGGDSPHKQLLCEQHRMRVVLTHTPARKLIRWAVHEVLATRRAFWPRRDLKRKALRWNLRHLPSTLRARWRLRAALPAPERLMDSSWGEEFPVGVTPLSRPDLAAATSAVDMNDPAVTQTLPYGWYPPEDIGGRTYGWAGTQAAAVIRLDAPAHRLHLEYANAPEDTGGVNVEIRRVGGSDPLQAVWSTHLGWQFIERCVENHPLRLGPGDYEVVFGTPRAWSNPPEETRSLGFALLGMSFHESYDLTPGGVSMGAAGIAEQLVNGWFEAEGDPDHPYRWAAGHASALMRIQDPTAGIRLSYCLPPAPTAGVRLSIRELGRAREAWSTHLPYRDSAWREERFAVPLTEGDYIVEFDAPTTWSNPDGRNPAFAPESRSLGLALAALDLEEAPADAGAA